MNKIYPECYLVHKEIGDNNYTIDYSDDNDKKCQKCKHFGSVSVYWVCKQGSTISLWFNGPKIVSCCGKCSKFEEYDKNKGYLDGVSKLKQFILEANEFKYGR